MIPLLLIRLSSSAAVAFEGEVVFIDVPAQDRTVGVASESHTIAVRARPTIQIPDDREAES